MQEPPREDTVAPVRTDDTPTPVGMYGFALEGLYGARHRLRPVRPHARTLRISTVLDDGTPPQGTSTGMTAGSAVLRFSGNAGWLRLVRESLHAELHFRGLPTDETLVHPGLAAVGAVSAHWQGWETFHGGAFIVDGGAWAVLGVKEAGKSSLLAQLHLLGVPVITDDLVVVDDGQVLAGPGLVDLRDGAAVHLGAGQRLGATVAKPEDVRERWRLGLPPVPAAVPLAGWLVPAWSGPGDAVEVRDAPVIDRLPLLASNTALNEPPPDPRTFFDLATLPVLVWRRPRDWAAMEDAVHVLLAALAGRS